MRPGRLRGSLDGMGQQEGGLDLNEPREQSLPCCLHSDNRVQEEGTLFFKSFY